MLSILYVLLSHLSFSFSFFLRNYLFKSFAHFLIGLFILLSCRSSLYILYNPLLDIWLASIFSHSLCSSRSWMHSFSFWCCRLSFKLPPSPTPTGQRNTLPGCLGPVLSLVLGSVGQGGTGGVDVVGCELLGTDVQWAVGTVFHARTRDCVERSGRIYTDLKQSPRGGANAFTFPSWVHSYSEAVATHRMKDTRWNRSAPSVLPPHVTPTPTPLSQCTQATLFVQAPVGLRGWSGLRTSKWGAPQDCS